MAKQSGLERWWEPSLIQVNCVQPHCEVLLLWCHLNTHLLINSLNSSVYEPSVLLMELV